MTAVTVTVIPAKELQTLTLVCPKCDTRITVTHDARLVEGCPACRHEFDKGAHNAQLRFQNFHQALESTAVALEFSIAQPVDRR